MVSIRFHQLPTERYQSWALGQSKWDKVSWQHLPWAQNDDQTSHPLNQPFCGHLLDLIILREGLSQSSYPGVCGPGGRRKKEESENLPHAIKTNSNVLWGRIKTCVWILKIISKTSKNFLEHSPFGLYVPQIPKVTYLHIGDMLVKKFEMCWIHPLNHFLISLVVFFSFLTYVYQSHACT